MSAEPQAPPMEWVDVNGRRWRVELPPGRILLRGEDSVVDVPASRWAEDLYIAGHGEGFIVRFEGFDGSLGFLLSREQGLPLLAHLGVVPQQTPAEPEAPAAPAAALLWPRVSPLAVWALICSALVFVPLAGILPAIATIVLLILHRLRVRRSAAYAHSRAICTAAIVFLLTGGAVCVLATLGMLRYRGDLATTSVFADSHTQRNIAAIVYGVFVVLLSLTVHEAAHAITAWWLGDGLARSLGRVTLNPLAHIDPFGTVLLPAILAWAGGPVFGYARPVPVQVEALPRWRRAHILIALAGPGSNLLLACASLLLLLGIGCVVRLAGAGPIVNYASFDFTAPVVVVGVPFGALIGPLCMILKLAFFINVALALFNLIPIPPLDGSWVLEHLFPGTLGRLYAVLRPFGVWVFLAAIYFNIFDFLVYPLLVVIVPSLFLLSISTGM